MWIPVGRRAPTGSEVWDIRDVSSLELKVASMLCRASSWSPQQAQLSRMASLAAASTIVARGRAARCVWVSPCMEKMPCGLFVNVLLGDADCISARWRTWRLRGHSGRASGAKFGSDRTNRGFGLCWPQQEANYVPKFANSKFVEGHGNFNVGFEFQLFNVEKLLKPPATFLFKG